MPLEDISQLVGHVSTSVTETVYRHEIRPALTKGAAAMDKILKKATKSASESGPRRGSRRSKRVRDGSPEPLLTCVGTAGFELATP